MEMIVSNKLMKNCKKKGLKTKLRNRKNSYEECDIEWNTRVITFTKLKSIMMKHSTDIQIAVAYGKA